MKNFTFPVLLSLIMFMVTNPGHADTNASVAAGDNHSLLLRTDGSLWSMGRNDRGQLGNGSELERGLVGWWKFDGDATDSSGNGNDGTVNGATPTTDRHGQANGAYSFDGVDDYIQTPESNKFSIQDQITVSFWFELNSFEAGNFIQKGNSSTGWEWELWTGNGTTSTGIHLANGLNWHIGAINSDQQVDLNKYSNLAMVFDASNFLKLYLDGKLVGYSTSFNSSFSRGLSPLFIGARKGWAGHDDPFRPFNGSIDDIRIYDRALSSSEVSALYTLESSPPNYEPVKIVDENVTAISAGSETSYFIKNDGSLWGLGRNDRGQLGNAQGLDQGLVGWWKFDGGATDSSGNGNDGTVNGATLTTDRHGQANEAYSFDGVNDYIEVPYNSALNGSTSSYTLWCRADALDANYGSPLTTRHGSPRAGFSVYKQPDNFWRLMIGQSSDAWSTDSSAIPVDQGNWVFISVLVDSSTARFFVDGELAQNLSNLVLNSSSPLRFGAGRTESTADYFFNGSIDDVRIYNRVLSVSEISALYTLESQPFDQFSPVQIVDSNVTGVSSRGSHALFKKTDGSLWAMGANEYGQLGDGTTTDRHTPIQVFAWEEIASNSLARSAFDGVEALDGKLYFAGGYTPSASSVFESFDPSTGSWQTLPSLATARIGISMSAYNGKLYVFGGSTAGGPGNKLDSMEIYDSVTNSWSAGPNLPVACNYSVAVTYGDKILVFGGWDQAEDNMDQVLEFDPSLNIWSAKTSMPVGRSGMKAVVCGGKVWIMGGLTGVGNDYSNRVDVYDPTTDTWSQMPDLTVARHWALAWTLNGQVYIGGGRPDASTYLTTIESYDASANQWRVIGNLPYGAYQTDTALINGKLYLSGGYDGSSHSNKLYVADLNPVTTFSAGGDHSRFVQADGSLWAMGRNHAGQIGDGTTTDRTSPVKVVNSGVAEVASGLSHGYYLTTSGDLWAMGWNADGQLGDGTTTNRNSPVQVLNGSNVSQVSAGSKEGFFVQSDGTTWAMGRNDFGQLGNADTADQSTPEIIFGWKELTGHSQARYAYDGLEVIDGKLYFAGGYDGTSSDTFERYDPSTNQWTPLPSLNSARYGVMGAVLNDQFYAIGGYNTASSSHLSSVEIYDPSANSWSSGSQFPINILQGRAITLNDKIFVFGGHDVSAEVSSVREYDPGTEEWTSKASMNTARHGHQIAVYDQKIWIMGGTDGSNHLNTVEIYDPATDSWSAGPNLITPRLWAVAWVANGQLFIGGGRSNSSTYLDTIESYDPDSDSWSVVGSLPSTSHVGDVAVVEDKLFLLIGSTSPGVYSNKLYVSDMQVVREIRGNSSTGHTLLVRADNSFGAMGQNNYGQLGDNSLADKSYPVSLMNTYDVVMTSGTGGSATGAGIYYAGAEVTIGASPSPGYLFGNWSGDFSSTDANDSFIINADYVIAASFSQDTEDDDDDGLNNYYELAVLGSNPLSGDTDGDGFSDLDENTTGLDPTVANTALYNHLSKLVELARSEGNATGYQAGLSDGNASGILYVQNNKTLYDLYTQEEANSSANERYADGVTEGNASGIAWASQNWSLYSLYSGEEKNASASTQYSLGFTEGNTSGYAQGLLDGNTSGIAWGQAHRTDYHFYTGEEVNSSAEAQYTLGYSEGNTTGYAQGLPDGNVSGVDYAFEQRADYDLFTQVEINASADTQYNTGYAEGNASGYSRGFSEGNATAVSLGMEQPETANLFTEEENIVTKQESVTRGFSSVQADLAREGLSLKAYYERIKDLQVPHLSDWHYHPTMGWLWTDRETFPFIYRAQSEIHTGGWLYFSNRKEHRATPLYDYAMGEWSMIPGSP